MKGESYLVTPRIRNWNQINDDLFKLYGGLHLATRESKSFLPLKYGTTT